MTFVHGRDTYVSVNSVDLSAFTNTSTFTRSADSHDVTTYGKDDHVFSGGLRTSTVSLTGIYDAASGGPGATLRSLIGTVVTFVRRPEGTGSSKPQESVSVLVTSYAETNPVADMISWTCELQCSDSITTTTQ